MSFLPIGHLAQQQLGKTRALVERHRKGQRITTRDQVATIDSLVELDAFEAEIGRQNAMTEELRAAIWWRRFDLTPKTNGKRRGVA